MITTTITIKTTDHSQVLDELELIIDAIRDDSIMDYERMDGSIGMNHTMIEVEDDEDL